MSIVTPDIYKAGKVRSSSFFLRGGGGEKGTRIRYFPRWNFLIDHNGSSLFKIRKQITRNYEWVTKASLLKQNNTVEPRYKEVGYNNTLLKQGKFAGPSSLYFLVFFYPDIMRNLI